MKEFKICTPSTILPLHSMYQNGSVSTESRQTDLPAGSGPGSMSDRGRMENEQGLGPPVMGAESFRSELAWMGGGVMDRAQPGSLGTRRDSSSCREQSLLKAIFFLTPSSGKCYDFNSQFYKMGLKCL